VFSGGEKGDGGKILKNADLTKCGPGLESGVEIAQRKLKIARENSLKHRNENGRGLYVDLSSGWPGEGSGKVLIQTRENAKRRQGGP